VNSDPIPYFDAPPVPCELTPAKAIPKFAVAGFDRRLVDLPVLRWPGLAGEHRVTTSTNRQSWIDRSRGRDCP
jgi:hypothetical protein